MGDFGKEPVGLGGYNHSCYFYHLHSCWLFVQSLSCAAPLCSSQCPHDSANFLSCNSASKYFLRQLSSTHASRMSYSKCSVCRNFTFSGKGSRGPTNKPPMRTGEPKGKWKPQQVIYCNKNLLIIYSERFPHKRCEPRLTDLLRHNDTRL